jgi:ubiquitin-protein ligase E3 C
LGLNHIELSVAKVTIHDIEFYGDEVEGEEPQKHRWMPFTLSELVPMSLALRDATLGLVELAYPETRPPMLSDEYKTSLAFETSSNYLSQSDEVSVWTHLFKATVELVRQLHTRDTRRRFCPGK